MNKEQQDFINLAYQGHNVFLTGAGGTGKSYIIQHLVDKYKAVNKTYGLTSMTGCAALLLGKASTLHSWACVGLAKDSADKLIQTINGSYRSKRKWLTTEVLIVDEVSMMDIDLFEKLDAIGRAIRKVPKPFGGIQIIFVGDFYQLPPVDKGSPKFIFESDLWPKMDFKVVELTQVIRQKDPVFHKILAEARIGAISDESLKILKERMGLHWQSLEIKPTLLFPKKDIVANVNNHGLSKLPDPEYVYKVETLCPTKKGDDLVFATQKALRNAPYDETVVLKVGAQVMLLINKNDGSELVNGSRGVVTGFTTSSIPLVKFHSHQVPIPIDKYTWELDDGLMSQTQLPLKLAYALTVHKSQGSTLDSALIDIGADIFEYGQAYVALSRVKGLDCLYINNINIKSFKANPRVKQFYKDLIPTDIVPVIVVIPNMFKNKGRRWSDEEVMGLLKSIKAKKTHDIIANEHQRTVGAIVSKLKEIAADYYFENGLSIDNIKKYTGLDEVLINDAISRRPA